MEERREINVDSYLIYDQKDILVLWEGNDLFSK
jgi:hypothetical protein